MVGLMVCVLVAKDQVDLIRNLQVQRSEVAVGGLSGSKGALCHHLKYYLILSFVFSLVDSNGD
jgi:hypothetical protein